MEHKLLLEISKPLEKIFNKALDIWEKKTNTQPTMVDGIMPGMSKAFETAMQEGMKQYPGSPDAQTPPTYPTDDIDPTIPEPSISIDDIDVKYQELAVKQALENNKTENEQVQYIIANLNITPEDALKLLKKYKNN